MTDAPDTPHGESSLSRRSMLVGVGLGGAAVGAGAASVATHIVEGGRRHPAQEQEPTPTSSPPADSPPGFISGAHQSGIMTKPQTFCHITAFRFVENPSVSALRRILTMWTEDSDRLMTGRTPLGDLEAELAEHTAGLTITIGLGPAVFDIEELASDRPSWLHPLPAFPGDELSEQHSGGDLVVQACADDALTAAHAMRSLTRAVSSYAKPQWTQLGNRSVSPRGDLPRNAFGQVDGTANPTPKDDTEPSAVWIGDGAPDWLLGGTSMVIRRIAMNLAAWEEAARPVREESIGRRLSDGAPLTGGDAFTDVDLTADDDNGQPIIHAHAHVRLARAADPSLRILRRPYTYDVGDDPLSERGTGLIFVTFQRDVEAQFTPIQNSLAKSDLLNQWITHIGSAVFVIPRAPRPGEYLAQSLIEGATTRVR